MNAKTAIAGLNITAAQAINEALQRHRIDPAMPHPTRIFLGERAYAMLHEEAASGGMWAEPFPRFEDDRLEYKGMKVHCHRSSSIEFELTPPAIIAALGDFDLDPCSPIKRPWPTAMRHLTLRDNSLLMDWGAPTVRVWLNPPYGAEQVGRFLGRLAGHGNGIALVFARTETDWFFTNIWERADAVLFFRGRLCFHHSNGKPADGNAGAPSVLAAYGKTNVDALRMSGLDGKFIPLT